MPNDGTALTLDEALAELAELFPEHFSEAVTREDEEVTE